MDARRGYVPEDGYNFSPESLRKMSAAVQHISYLINEGYDLKQASTFVGNHFLFSERQRLALARTVATEQQIQIRTRKRKDITVLAGQTAWIDGLNEIITLEVMYSHGILLRCMDGTIRDLAGLRGTYRLIPETDQAIQLLLETIQDADIAEAVILLDEPVSNSGRLKTRIAEIGEPFSIDLDIEICRDVDKVLYAHDNVVTSDSIILDHCCSWLNLTEICLAKKHADVIDLTEGVVKMS